MERNTKPKLSDYVYVVGLKRFVHTGNFDMLDKEQFNAVFARQYDLDVRRSASHKFLTGTGEVVAGVTYLPDGSGACIVTDDEGRRCLNTYHPPKLGPNLKATEADVKIWLDHVALNHPRRQISGAHSRFLRGEASEPPPENQSRPAHPGGPRHREGRHDRAAPRRLRTAEQK